MTWIDHGRRAVTVVLVVLAMLTVPAIARAAFTDRESGGLSTSTARMVAPANVTGTYRCIGNLFTEGFEATVASFVDSGPAGATYRYTLERGAKVVRTAPSASRSATLASGNLAVDVGRTEWTLTIQAVLGSWTGPVYTRSVTCAALSNATGTL